MAFYEPASLDTAATSQPFPPGLSHPSHPMFFLVGTIPVPDGFDGTMGVPDVIASASSCFLYDISLFFFQAIDDLRDWCAREADGDSHRCHERCAKALVWHSRFDSKLCWPLLARTRPQTHNRAVSRGLVGNLIIGL